MEIKLDFKIEACNPKNNSDFDNEDTKLSEAIYTIFPLETENAILSWGAENILLSYRYDISTIIDDIIQMIFTLQNNHTGKWFVNWSSNTFAVNWDFKWFEDSLEIEAQWREEFNASDYLKSHNILKIKKGEFIQEWKKIIDVLLVNLIECGYTCDNLTDMGLLIEANSIYQ